MAPITQFRILGPLEARIAGRRARITAPRELTTLAALLLERGKVVSVERLVNTVWADRPPMGPANQIAICISSLRRKLTGAGAAEGLIVTASPGYLLGERDCELDIDQVDTYAGEARKLIAAGRMDAAAGQLRSALDLWRGPVLSGIGSRSLQPEIVRWEERRLALAEQYAQLELDLGRSFEIIGDLSATVADQPLRERPRVQLMVALHRAGRTAEALDVYADFRRTLHKELGLEPGPELRALQEAVLNGKVGGVTPPPRDPDADRGRGKSGARVCSPPHPHPARCPHPTAAMLPTDIADFTGRTAQIEALTAALTEPRGMAVPIAVVCGPGGVGKTALAVHVAHRLAEDFPDGQLYADLHGARLDSAGSGEVLRQFLRVLGVNSWLMPDGMDQLAGVYRSLLANLRVLVVLDNVASKANLDTLLPGSPGCGVLLTSRTPLTGLAGARMLELDILGLDQAVALLRAILRSERMDAELGAATELVRYCGRLPLAVRIVGARLAAKPHWTLTGFVDRLVDERGRLDELAHGGLTVRASLARSYQELTPMGRRLFCRLGLLDVPEFATWSGVALLDADELRAAEAFEELVDARLLRVTVAGPADGIRYRFPDLVWLYARERAGWDEQAAERQAAVTRVMDAWFDLVRRARSGLVGGENGFTEEAGDTPGWRFPPAYARRLVADPLGWYEAERACLRAATLQAVREGFDAPGRDLAIAATALFRTAGNYQNPQKANEQALVASRRCADRGGEATALTILGEPHNDRLRFRLGAWLLRRAVRIFEELKDDRATALALVQIAHADAQRGRYQAAGPHTRPPSA